MPIYYENRKGELYYIKFATAKKGGKRYYIVKDKSKFKSDELLEEVPQGFEFYEFPYDARVVLRKMLKSSITDEEFSILDLVMKRHETVKDYIIDREKDALLIYTAHLDRELWNMLDDIQFRLTQSYDDKLRFEKNEKGEYEAQRFCYLSRYYGWIIMETSRDLKYLAEKYCYHIDKESLLQFWIEGEEEPQATVVGEIEGNPVYGFLGSL